MINLCNFFRDFSFRSLGFLSMTTLMFLFCDIYPYLIRCVHKCTRFCLSSRVFQSLHQHHLYFLLIDRDATLAHKAEALELQRQLRRLQTQYDLLTGQSSALIQGRRARVAATSAVSGQITAIEDSLSARNLQVSYTPSHNCKVESAFILVFDKFL